MIACLSAIYSKHEQSTAFLVLKTTYHCWHILSIYSDPHQPRRSSHLCPSNSMCPLFLSRSKSSLLTDTPMMLYLPFEKLTTAHLPLQAHFLCPLSPPPPSIALSFSSSPSFRPTTTSALQVRNARTLTPEPGPRGPMAFVKGVVGSH